MAKRFQSTYSPHSSEQKSTGTSKKQTRRKNRKRNSVKKASGRINVLYVPAFIMLWRSLGDGALGLTIALCSAFCFGLAAWLLSEGLKAETAFQARASAHRPAIPRKIFASVLSGLAVALSVVYNEANIPAAALFALCTTALHLLAFGIDPMKNKGIDASNSFQHARVSKAVNSAENHLKAMTETVKRTKDKTVVRRINDLCEVARELFRTVEEDPRDLTSARKYLSVYLEGAHNASVSFTNLYMKDHDPAVRQDFLALIDDLTDNFAARTHKLLDDNRTDLRVEIEVLRERLESETLKHKK